MKTTYKAMPKGKFAPQNREIKQKPPLVKSMSKVQFQNAATANTAAAIVRKQNDNLIPTAKSISLSGVKTSPYRFKHGIKS